MFNKFLTLISVAAIQLAANVCAPAMEYTFCSRVAGAEFCAFFELADEHGLQVSEDWLVSMQDIYLLRSPSDTQQLSIVRIDELLYERRRNRILIYFVDLSAHCRGYGEISCLGRRVRVTITEPCIDAEQAESDDVPGDDIDEAGFWDEDPAGQPDDR